MVVGWTKAFPFFTETRKRAYSLFSRNFGRKTAPHFSWQRALRLRVQSRRWVAVLPAVIGFGPPLAQSPRARHASHRSTIGHLGRLLAWAGILAVVTLLMAGVWWLLPLCLPVSFALRLH